MDESACNGEGQVLYTEPSFAIYGDEDNFEGGFGGEELTLQKLEEDEGKLERSATIGESIEPEFSFQRNLMEVIGEDGDGNEDGNANASNGFKDVKIDGGTEPRDDLDDEYYEAMVRQDPSNSWILRNYAQYLEVGFLLFQVWILWFYPKGMASWQAKGDFPGAEEYYSRATVADPEDSLVLCQYAKLVWEVHGDRARASDYFARAITVSPQDSNVLAAYASFLWKIEEHEDDDTKVDETNFEQEKRSSSPPAQPGMDAAGGDNAGEGTADEEEQYRRNVEENPSNPLFLRNYANFLHQSKADLSGAEEYYSRAMLADPSDGQTCSAYANVVWQLHRDEDRAAVCFERAVRAAPQDSDVLAAYAKFLWETDAKDNNNDSITAIAHD